MTLHEIAVVLVAAGAIAVGGAAFIHLKFWNRYPAHASYHSQLLVLIGVVLLAFGLLIEILK